MSTTPAPKLIVLPPMPPGMLFYPSFESEENIQKAIARWEAGERPSDVDRAWWPNLCAAIEQVESYRDLLGSFYDEHPRHQGKVIWIWKPIRSEWDVFDDVAQAYVITNTPTASSGGIVLYAKRCDKWEPNPWSSRAVLKRMLNMCGGEIFLSNHA